MASEKKLIDDLEKFAGELGKVPTAKEMRKSGPWDDSTYQRRFGSWNNALKEANLGVNYGVSKDTLIADLQKFAESIGKTPTVSEMNTSGPWSDVTYSKKFGSWNNAIKQAGLNVNNAHSVSDNELIADLQKFAESIGKTPTYTEMKNKGPRDGTTYERHFGSWNNALEKAGFKINCLGPDERAGTSEKYYGENWYAQRKTAVERDNYRCRICGDDKRPNVHHIKPRREFDNLSKSNSADNLITLCPSHHGSLEGKWKDATPDEFEKKAKEFLSLSA